MVQSQSGRSKQRKTIDRAVRWPNRRALEESSRFKRMWMSAGTSRAKRALRRKAKSMVGREATHALSLCDQSLSRSLAPLQSAGTFLAHLQMPLSCTPFAGSALTARLFCTTEIMMRVVPGISRTHPHEQPTMSVPPPVEGWPQRQYPRPPTSLLWGVKPPSQQPSEWSDAWTASVKEAAKQSDMTEETTLFLLNPGRHFLSSCDVTSPRFTRSGFGLNTKEFYAIVEPLRMPPPSREAKLMLRHGAVGRARGKYDSRTCQLGFGIVEVNYLF